MTGSSCDVWCKCRKEPTSEVFLPVSQLLFATNNRKSRGRMRNSARAKERGGFFSGKPKPKQSVQNTTSRTSRSSSQRGRGRPFITSPGRDLRPSAQSPSKTSQTLGSWCPQPKSKQPRYFYYYCQYSPIDGLIGLHLGGRLATQLAKPEAKLTGHRPRDQELRLQTQGRDNMQ